MNYLELVQEVHRESASGGTAPASLTGLRGENLRLAEWVQEADLEIQELHNDWEFLWSQQDLSLVADTYLYEPDPEVGEYDRSSFFLDDQLLNAVQYAEVKHEYRYNDDTGTPWRVVTMPDGRLRVDPTPTEAGTVRFDYWKPPVPMLEADQSSLIPERFYRVIVGLALTKYADYENAPEIAAKGAKMYAAWLLKLRANQLPGDRYKLATAEGNDLVMTVE